MAITLRTIFKKFKKTVNGILDTPFSFKLIFYFCLTLLSLGFLILLAIFIVAMMLGGIDAEPWPLFMAFVFSLLLFWSWRKVKKTKARLKKRN